MRRLGEYGMPGTLGEADLTEVEKTLRLIASVPAPEELVKRVQAGMAAAPRARVLHWPLTLMPGRWWMSSPALRGAAAAAIVCVVAGGGWRIYSHVQAPEAAKVVVMPARVGAQGGFSSAKAMRTPDALGGPVLTHAVKPQAAPARTKTPAARHKARHAEAAPAPVQPR